MQDATPEQIDAFITRWEKSGGHERGSGQQFLLQFCEKLRAEQPLTDKEKKIHDDGLVTILKQIHDELDEAVLEAYGWSDLAGTALRSGPANEMRMNEPNESPTGSTFDNASAFHSHGPPGGRSLPCADLLIRGGEIAEAIEQELLKRHVALHHARAEEETRGLIRWLRPSFTTARQTSGSFPML